jgi:hypothetical protein
MTLLGAAVRATTCGGRTRPEANRGSAHGRSSSVNTDSPGVFFRVASCVHLPSLNTESLLGDPILRRRLVRDVSSTRSTANKVTWLSERTGMR